MRLTAAPDAEALYLDLLKRVLTNVIYEDPPLPSEWSPGEGYDSRNRRMGLDWPSVAHTMVGLGRLDNVQQCVETVLADGVPGDLAETGVWRGGVCVLMRALLRAYGVRDRQVWVADSFQGMPPGGTGARPEDGPHGLDKWNDVIAVPLAEVRDTFERYGLLDDQVRFLPGWFSESLPVAPIRQLAVLRLDGDLYSSTIDALTHLYPLLSAGGFLIVDDYLLPDCRRAVHDYRDRHGVTDPVLDIDGVGAYWRTAG